MDSEPKIAPGRVLNGRWTLGPLLGRGASGLVFEAFHRNGIRAAAKVLHPHLAADADQVARFLREAAIASRLDHVGAVAALDDDRTEDGIVYVVYERVDGMALADLLAERAPLEVGPALGIADKILVVLAAAHGKGIVHRDLKPENVFLLPNGEVKLLDFGLARLEGGLATALCPAPTADGTVLGTPGFMPPEQALGRVDLVDARSDLWAASALLFVMLTGVRLHDAPTMADRLLRCASEPAPPLRSIRPDLPEAIAEVVDRGLAPRPEERFTSAEHMRSALAAARTARPSPQVAVERPTTPAEPFRPGFRRQPLRPSALLLAGVGVVGLAVLGWIAADAGASAPPASVPHASGAARAP